MRKPVAAVYSITHLATGRVYIGSSLDARRRMAAHRHLLRHGRHHSIHLQRAWTLYGDAAFAFAIVEQVVGDVLAREQFWIERSNAAHPTLGFNMAPTAGTRARVPHSLETRAAMSAMRKGKRKSAEHRAKIGEGNRGKQRTTEMRAVTAARVAQAMKDPIRRAQQAEYAKLAASPKGRIPSLETRQRMSAAAKRRAPNSSAELSQRAAGHGLLTPSLPFPLRALFQIP